MQDGGVDALLLRLKQEHEALQPDFKRGQVSHFVAALTNSIIAEIAVLNRISSVSAKHTQRGIRLAKRRCT